MELALFHAIYIKSEEKIKKDMNNIRKLALIKSALNATKIMLNVQDQSGNKRELLFIKLI